MHRSQCSWSIIVPELYLEKYAHIIQQTDRIDKALSSKWANPHRQFGIVTLVHCPHFGQMMSMHECVSFFLSRLFGGYLCLNQPYQVDEKTMYRVSCLPITYDDLANAIKAKDAKHEYFYTKYGIHRGSCEVVIIEINNQIVWFVTQLLSCKILWTFHKDEFLIGVTVVI